ncbi:MAG: CoA-binding protein [Candidatus Polarisedimenticolia bacterium]
MSPLEILKAYQTWAVVGLSDKPHRPSHTVASQLKERGYRIIPVNPNLTEVLGETCYPNLTSIPHAVEVVDIFRRSSEVGPIVDEAIAIGAKVVWMQLGVIDEAAAARARAAGLEVVMDRCPAIELGKMM